MLGWIGGLSRMLFLASRIINSLIPGYITLLDTEELLISLSDGKLGNQVPINIYKKNLTCPPKKENSNNFLQQTPNMLRSSKESDTIINNSFTGIEKRE